jgi:hypothetical protein
MTRSEVDEVLERVRTWPAEDQEEAALLLLALEERRLGAYEPDPEELAEIEAALEEAEREDPVPDEEIKALFDRYR